MSSRVILLLVILMAAAGLGLVGMQALRPTRTAQVVRQVAILTASHAVPGGTLLKDEDLSTVVVPEPEVPATALRDSPEERSNLHGALVLHYLDPGARISEADVLRPRDRGFLAAVLGAGKRAIAVGVDAVSGDAGLIWPGDRVDLILTENFAGADLAGERVAGEIVLANARVIAVDQSLVQGSDYNESHYANAVARTITLEVTPDQAQRVAVAERLGTLLATVRSASEKNEEIVPIQPVFASDVSLAIGKVGTNEAKEMLLIQGTEEREVKFQ
jgi:pilus assembly protein CpaB